MRKSLIMLAALFAATISGVLTMASGPSESHDKSKVAIVIHGGAGTILKENMSDELEQAYQQTLTEAIRAGHKILTDGGTSLDAVQAAIIIMEDSPLFNAGKGAVFTHEGRNEMDASVMTGHDLNAGAVAGVTRIKNPITLAAAVMQHSNHVMLSGAGAEAFAQEQQLEMVDPRYFHTERRWNQLQKVLKKASGETELSEDDKVSVVYPDDDKFGTVGAVALDHHGNITAATSTGGMTNKRYGRIGDSPVIGSGTYANAQCGVSATGHGEYFIRAAVAHDICARMEYLNIPLNQAADAVVMKRLVEMKGEGGIIALDNEGNIAMPFNTAGMYRASIDASGQLTIGIYQ